MAESIAIARAALARAQENVANATHARSELALRLALADSALGDLWIARDEARRRLDRLITDAAAEREADALGAAIDNGTAGRPPDGR